MKKNKTGVTLIELLVAVAILTMLIIPVNNLFKQVISINRNFNGINEITKDYGTIAYFLHFDAQRAATILNSYTNFISDSSTLILRENSNNNIIVYRCEKKGLLIRYAFSGGKESKIILSNNICNAYFEGGIKPHFYFTCLITNHINNKTIKFEVVETLRGYGIQ